MRKRCNICVFIYRELYMHLTRRTRGNNQKITQSTRFRVHTGVCKRTRATTGVDAENTMIYGVCIPANNAETLGLENLWSAFARMHQRQPHTISARTNA
jgi:hypothetical protein